MLKSLTIADRILIVVISVSVLASFVAATMLTSQGSVVIVQVNGSTVHKANLFESHTALIAGTRGNLTVEARDGKVAITRADCPNHICVRMGWRSQAGDVIVCVPNKTIVRILPDGPQGARAVTG
jgi:hypothetical protein